MVTDNEILSHVRLHTAIQLSTTEEEWQDGYETAQQGSKESSNPYQASSNAYQNWQDGWWAGFYGEEPLFAQQAEKATPVLKTKKPLVIKAGKLQIPLWQFIFQAACASLAIALAYDLAT